MRFVGLVLTPARWLVLLLLLLLLAPSINALCFSTPRANEVATTGVWNENFYSLGQPIGKLCEFVIYTTVCILRLQSGSRGKRREKKRRLLLPGEGGAFEQSKGVGSLSDHRAAQTSIAI